MATALSLGVPKKFTLAASAGVIEEVTCPVGTKTLLINSAEPVYYDASGNGDGNAGDAATQFKFDAGTFSNRFPGMGQNEQTALTVATAFGFVGESDAQEVWMWAVAEI